MLYSLNDKLWKLGLAEIVYNKRLNFTHIRDKTHEIFSLTENQVCPRLNSYFVLSLSLDTISSRHNNIKYCICRFS